MDTYLDWHTAAYKPPLPLTAASTAPEQDPQQQQQQQQDAEAAAAAPAPATRGDEPSPAPVAPHAPAALPPPPRRSMGAGTPIPGAWAPCWAGSRPSRRHSAAAQTACSPQQPRGTPARPPAFAGAPPPVPLFMLEFEAQEDAAHLSRKYTNIEWHRHAFEGLRAAAGLAEVDRLPVEEFVKGLMQAVMELVGGELGRVDERGLGLGLGPADLEHLVRPLYG